MGPVRKLWYFGYRLIASRRLPRLLRIRPLRLTISEFGGLRLKPERVEFPDSEETPNVTSGL